MLTKFVSFFGCYLFLLTAHAQIYIDPAVAAATGVHAGVMNSQLNDVNNNLTLIQRGQMAVTGQLLKSLYGLSKHDGANAPFFIAGKSCKCA